MEKPLYWPPPMPDKSPTTLTSPRRLWSSRSLALIVFAWAILQIGGLFTPGLLDDVDSVYIQIAREMLARHDFVTPTVDGIRFFDKPPLLYWMAAGSMHLFGIHDWAARLPLALGVLALFIAVYALGLRLYAAVSPADNPDRAALYAALATATSIGPYLYTRFYIPDILIALWMTLSVHLFLVARERALFLIPQSLEKTTGVILSGAKDPRISPEAATISTPPLWPSLAFGAVMALDVLTKGLIGVVLPLAFVLLFLLIQRELGLLRKLHILPATAVFLLIAAPWHILAALRNPAIAMPTGLGLPAHAGWAWFYLFNEHIARFLGRRIPHDYGQVPIPLFWLLLFIWLIPWAAFLPSALRNAFTALRQARYQRLSSRPEREARSGETPVFGTASAEGTSKFTPVLCSLGPEPSKDAALTTLLWAGIILGFFTISSRQEYYHLPALPALALLVGALLAAADNQPSEARQQALRWSAWFLVPLGLLLFAICGYFALTTHTPPRGADLYNVLNNDPAHYNLSLGHLFDLTGTAMGFFRGPLLTVALGMLVLGPAQHLLRRRTRTFAANLAVAVGMTAVLLAAHEGLARFYPTLGSKELALTVKQQLQPGDILALDGELTSGSTLLFYTGQPVLLVNGHVNGPWFGSFWPDAPHVFLDDAALHKLWSGPHRVFLLTYHTETRSIDLAAYGKVHTVATAGGKTILSNEP